MFFVEPFGRDVLLQFSLSNRCPKKQQSQQHITAKADNGFADTSPNGALPNVAISQRPGAKMGMREILGSNYVRIRCAPNDRYKL